MVGLLQRRVVVSQLALVVLALVSCSQQPQWEEIKSTIRQEFPTVPQMSVTELAELLADGAPQRPLLVDVRAPEEYAVSHLANALNASGDELRRLVEQAGDRPVVLYCSVGYRSSSEAQALIESGFSRVANLEGSIFEWANAGNPVYRGRERVEQVHPYDQDWGRLLDSSLHADRD